MPYLDGTPAPGDKESNPTLDKIKAAQDGRKAIQIEVTEPEQMVGDLLAIIYRATGRRMTRVDITWHGDGDAARPVRIGVASEQDLDYGV